MSFGPIANIDCNTSVHTEFVLASDVYYVTTYCILRMHVFCVYNCVAYSTFCCT